jgi:hypothetical protein
MPLNAPEFKVTVKPGVEADLLPQRDDWFAQLGAAI